MCFSFALWSMVIDCLSVFLFSIDYLSVFVEEKFIFCLLPFLLFCYFIFCLFSVLYFLNLPAPGLRGSSNTEKNYSYFILYMEDMEKLGGAEVDLSSSFLSPALPDGDLKF